MRGVKQVKESTGRGKKHRYSTEFKVTAVKMSSAPDTEVQAVAEALGIHPFMLSRWKKEHREGKLKGRPHPDLKEVTRLERTVAEHKKIRKLEAALKKAKIESDLLKSYPVQFGTKADLFAFIDRHHEDYGVTFLCRYYRVTRSGYYAWKHRAPGLRQQANQKLLSTIHRIHERSPGIYGSPRVWETLKRQGVPCSENRVARLMRNAGLTGRVVKVTRRQPGLHRFFIATPNLRKDQPIPTGPDQQWVGDITYLKARGRFCYLATMMDVCSRPRPRRPHVPFRPRDRIRGLSVQGDAGRTRHPL